MRLFWLLMTSVIIFLKLRVSQRCDRQKTKRTGPHYVLVESCTSRLTSLPMQRCCPTPFSHLWCRLILQALQRRPCFAVFPARNTTCLAVVPGNTQEKNARMLRFSRVVVGGGGELGRLVFLSSELQITHKVAGDVERIGHDYISICGALFPA